MSLRVAEASTKTISKALHARSIYFRKLTEKPTLTKQDTKDRAVFAAKYGDKSGNWWLQSIHMHIDVKHFNVFLDSKGRRHAAQIGCRGAYRALGERFGKGVVKPSAKLKFNTGTRGIKVLAGVGGNGKILMWHFIEGRWNGTMAAKCYKGPVSKALAAAFPAKRRYTVLEDNDPAGFKSSLGRAAKAEAKISVFEIPKRSPDLNVCDYSLWKLVNTRMRAQEARWPTARKETRKAFLARLKRTAMRLPVSIVKRSIQSMKQRCKLLKEAKGGHIAEGRVAR